MGKNDWHGVFDDTTTIPSTDNKFVEHAVAELHSSQMNYTITPVLFMSNCTFPFFFFTQFPYASPVIISHQLQVQMRCSNATILATVQPKQR